MINYSQKPLLGTPLDFSHPISRKMLGSYLFNDKSGSRVSDTGGNKRDGIFNASGVTWQTGQHGPHVSFAAGGPNYIPITMPDVGNVYSFAIRFRPTAADNAFAVMIGQAFNIAVYFRGGRYIDFYVTGSHPARQILDLGTWYDVVCTSDGTTIRTYVDAVEDDWSPWTTSVNFNDPRFIGGDGNSGQQFGGDMSFVYIWGRTLSLPEIITLHMDPFVLYRKPSMTSLFIPPPAPGGMFTSVGEGGLVGISKGLVA